MASDLVDHERVLTLLKGRIQEKKSWGRDQIANLIAQLEADSMLEREVSPRPSGHKPAQVETPPSPLTTGEPTGTPPADMATDQPTSAEGGSYGRDGSEGRRGVRRGNERGDAAGALAGAR